MHAPSIPAVGPIASLMRFVARVAEAGRNRRVVHGLAMLDDHMLRDIGLTRNDVHAALVEPAMADGTLILSERAQAQRRSQSAHAGQAQVWGELLSATGRRAG